MTTPGRGARLARCLPSYARIAFWGLVAPRAPGSRPLVVHQGVVLGPRGVLLGMRTDLLGWELPGGHADAGESARRAIEELLELPRVRGVFVGARERLLQIA